MKKNILVAVFCLFCLFSFAQSEKAKALVNEGIALHDKGEYDNAIKKYDAAIAEDPAYIDAYYEKSFSLYSMKKYDECIELSKQMIKQFPDNPLLKAVYVQYGSSLDDQGKSADAIKIYNEGLKKFPGYFLLNFNKGITYSIMNDADKAYESYQEALISNPFHASSYYRVGELLKSTNHIPAMMACIMQLIVEPETDRAATSFATLKELMFGSVKKTGENSITITMDAGMLDTKKSKKKPDNFSMQEMIFNMSAALDKDSVLNSTSKTEIEKFDLRLQLLIGSLNDKEKGFFSERYVPFFKSMKENKYTMIVSRLVFAHTGEERNKIWLTANTGKTDEFYDWLKAYKWPEK
ncbi:tetratricopeptide repeat protein [Ferruginibacter profundus]